MKAAAARQETDGDDLRILAGMLGIRTVSAALDLVESFYRPDRLTAKTQLLLEEILSGDA